MKTILHLMIDVQLKQRLEYFKRETGIPFSRIVRNALLHHLDREEKRYNLQMPIFQGDGQEPKGNNNEPSNT